MQSITVFFDITKVADFQWRNADVSRAQEACHVNYIFFGSFLGVQSFIIAEYVWQILWRGAFATPSLPHSSVSTSKKPILNRVNNRSVKISFQKTYFLYFMGTNSLRTLFKQKFLYLLFSGERNCWCTLE